MSARQCQHNERGSWCTRAAGHEGAHHVLHPDEPEPYVAPCAWWAACENAATGTRFHPILGDVPICDRCDARVEVIRAGD